MRDVILRTVMATLATTMDGGVAFPGNLGILQEHALCHTRSMYIRPTCDVRRRFQTPARPLRPADVGGGPRVSWRGLIPN